VFHAACCKEHHLHTQFGNLKVYVFILGTAYFVREKLICDLIVFNFHEEAQSLRNYIDDVFKAAEFLQYDASEEQLVDRMLMNLHPAVLAQSSFLDRPRSRKELLHVVGLIEERAAVAQERCKMRFSEKARRIALKTPHGNARVVGRAVMKCWNCNQVGHLRRACPRMIESSRNGQSPGDPCRWFILRSLTTRRRIPSAWICVPGFWAGKRLLANSSCLKSYCVTNPYRAKRRRFVIPASLRPMVLQYFHDSIHGGHLGSLKTFQKIAANFYWPKWGLRSSNTYARATCVSGPKPPKTAVGLHSASPMTFPMERVFIDFMGPLTRSKRGSVAILAVLDGFSKFVTFYPTRRITSNEVCDRLERQYFRLTAHLVRLLRTTLKFSGPKVSRICVFVGA
jgi:hypothetical protein